MFWTPIATDRPIWRCISRHSHIVTDTTNLQIVSRDPCDVLCLRLIALFTAYKLDFTSWTSGHRVFTAHRLNWTIDPVIQCVHWSRASMSRLHFAAAKLGQLVLGWFSTHVLQCGCSHRSLLTVREQQFSSVHVLCASLQQPISVAWRRLGRRTAEITLF